MNGSLDVAQYVAQIHVLEGQLEIAGEHLDHKVGELGDAGLSLVDITQRLQASRMHVGELEREVDMLKKSEDRIKKRLERCKCLKCGRRFDASGVVVLAGNSSVR